MTPKTPNPAAAARLRRRAERRRAARARTGPTAPRSPAVPRLLHELEIHQIELEMQNAELQRARAEADAALERYTELYDLAPVGYLTVDRKGVIQEANLTGAAMLGLVRARVLRRPFQRFAAPLSRAAIAAYLERAFEEPGRHGCEALLCTAAGGTFWANLQATATTDGDTAPQRCRLIISDISALKRADASRLRVEELSAAVVSANREIARRREAERSLAESETQQRELREAAQAMHAQLRLLTHQILLAQEEERKAISRQLHDEIAQLLAGIGIHLAALKSAANDPPKLRRRLTSTHRLITRSIKLVHDFARDLRPALLDDIGLVPALRSFVKDLGRRHRLSIEFSALPPAEELDNIRRTVLYRVAQEALTNVIRHADARKVSVRLRRTADGVRLEVHDDGHSFPAAQLVAATHSGRLGLLGMRERVEMVGGRFTITALPGKGTLIAAEVPTNPAASFEPATPAKG